MSFVLVTGASGFLGAAVVERLAARGHAVRALVRPGRRREHLERLAAAPRSGLGRVEVVQGDLDSPAGAAALLPGIGIVYHLAAAMTGSADAIFAATVVATEHLVDAMAAVPQPPRLVLCSSFSVYGVAELARGALVDETTPLEPYPERRDPYAQAKLAQERVAWAAHREQRVPLTVVRPGVIYGPGGAAMSGRVGLSAKGILFHMGGSNLLPLTYVDNCAEALAIAGERCPGAGEIVNVVDDDLPSSRVYLRRYRRHVPTTVVPMPYPVARGLARAAAELGRLSGGRWRAPLSPYAVDSTWKGQRFSNARLKALGWRPLVSTDEGLARTFAALASRPTSRPAP